MKRQMLIIILLILNALIVFIPTTIVRGDPSGGTIDGDTVWWENEYANMSVYPATSDELINHWQLCNMTWLYSDQIIDVAFRFNESQEFLSGHVFKWDGSNWQDVELTQAIYNGKKYYYYAGWNVIHNTKYKFKFLYNMTANSTGKWDLMAKLSNDTIQDALSSGRYVMLDPWWSTDWEYRIGITIDPTGVPNTVANFPLMVNLSGATDLITNAQADGGDLRFVNQANTTELYYHFDTDFSTYHKVWVQIPSVDETVDTYFNCYYGHATADLSTYYDSDTVWRADYAAVYYGNSTFDMSGNDYSFTNVGSVASVVTTDGNGEAYKFEGTPDEFIMDEALISLSMLTSGGYFCSYQMVSAGDQHFSDYNSSDSSDYVQSYMIMAGDLTSIVYDDTVEEYNQQTAYVGLTDMGLLSFQYDGTNGMQWVDPSATAFVDVTAITNPANEDDGRLMFGVNSITGAAHLQGLVDMIVYLDANLSAAEMSLWGHNIRGGEGLVTIGSQVLGVPKIRTDVATNVSGTTADLNGEVTETVTSPVTVGFLYGTTTPVTEANADNNITVGTGYNVHQDFTYNITALSEGTVYYFMAWVNDTTGYYFLDSGNEKTFSTTPNPPTSLVLSLGSNNSLNISWSTPHSSPVTSVVVAEVGSYPDDWSDGDILNNDSGTYYWFEPEGGQYWYFRIWSHLNPFSETYIEGNYGIPPDPPTNVDVVVSATSFDITWTNGTGARTTIVVRKQGSFPGAVTDGTQVYNDTGTSYTSTFFEDNYYYALYSQSNGTYSTRVTVAVGGLVTNCYDEETNESLEFDIFISNADGSQAHEARNLTNGYNLSISDLPLGDAIKFVISASQNHSDQSESFNYGIDENSTITYIVLAYPPENKVSMNITCINESDNAYSYPPFTLDSDLITILADDADNFTKVFVNYTYYEYQSRTYYRDINSSSFYLLNAYLPPSNLASLYLLEVLDQYDQSLEDAYIEVKNKVNNTYVVVSGLYTDANGQADVYLMEFSNYIFIISKDDYVTENASWTPGDLIFTHTFKLRLESDVDMPPEFGEIISLRGVISEDNTLTVTFYDKDDAMLNSHFYVLEYYNQTFSYMGEYNGTTSSSITFTVDIVNHSRMHIVRLYMNHSNLGETVNYSIYVMPVAEERDEGNWLENLIRSVVGDFDYGYVITIIWVMPCILLLAGFGSMHQPGIGILGAGMWSGWFTSYLIMPNEGDILVFAGIALIVAFLVIVLKQGKKVVHEG